MAPRAQDGAVQRVHVRPRPVVPQGDDDGRVALRVEPRYPPPVPSRARCSTMVPAPSNALRRANWRRPMVMAPARGCSCHPHGAGSRVSWRAASAATADHRVPWALQGRDQHGSLFAVHGARCRAGRASRASSAGRVADGNAGRWTSLSVRPALPGPWRGGSSRRHRPHYLYRRHPPSPLMAPLSVLYDASP